MDQGRTLTPREQGDLGEFSAMQWLAEKGARIYLPLGHSPDVDLIAEVGGSVLRVEVKTTASGADGRWHASIATHGGNQSWSGMVKRFDPSRCEFLFVHVGDGRRWFIPTGALEAEVGITLGGPKYSEFEIEPGSPLARHPGDGSLESRAAEGEYRSGQTGRAVNALAKPSQVRILPPPLPTNREPVSPSKYERKLGRSCQAIINQKRRLTVPQQPFFAAGFENGGRVRVSCDGPGRILVEQVELPAWARPSDDAGGLSEQGAPPTGLA